MGILNLTLVENTKMKFIAVACLIAAAFAEPEAKAYADAALLYGGFGYTGLGYAGLGYSGLGYAGYGYPYTGYSAYAPYTYGARVIGKRSADAEPEAEADPALLYGAYGYTGLGYSGYRGLGYSAYAGYPYTRAYAGYPYVGGYAGYGGYAWGK